MPCEIAGTFAIESAVYRAISPITTAFYCIYAVAAIELRAVSLSEGFGATNSAWSRDFIFLLSMYRKEWLPPLGAGAQDVDKVIRLPE